jgi:uncharacterized protein (TIGR02246 family)
MSTVADFLFWIGARALILNVKYDARLVKNGLPDLIDHLRCGSENASLFPLGRNKAKARPFKRRRRMEGAMRFKVLFGAGALATGGLAINSAAAEVARSETCRKGDDNRVIEVVAPGTVGAACDVRYVRDGGANVTTPYNANSDRNFCRARAAELVATLIAEGFECSTPASDAIEASLAGGAPRTADASSDTLDAQLAAMENRETGETAGTLEKLEQPPTPEAASTAARPSAPGVEFALAESEPVQLAGDVRPSTYRAPRPPLSTGPGRLVGAQPSIDDIIDVSANAPAPIATEPQTAAAVTAAGVAPRAPEDIIRSVLAANVASWNEGNLAAFLGGYSDAGEVTLTRGSVVVKGWGEVRRHYGEEIAGAGEMGRLTFDAVKVELTAADAATVTGRYRVERSGGASKGAMSLVMKQIEGRWRIVDDARVADAEFKE